LASTWSIVMDSRRILIIDDSEDDRDLYRRYLAKDTLADWVIVESQDGEEGVSRFHADPSDLVLLDYSLPGRSGIDLLNDFRGNKHYVPVVLVTGQGNEAIAIECMKNGAQDYLVKGDITPESLQRAVHNALDRIAMFDKINRQHESLRNFAHLLAHDLKAPIKRMMALGDIIEESVGNKDYAVADRYFREVKKSALHMDRLIDALDDYNKLDGNELPFEQVSIRTLVDDVLSMLGEAIRESGAKVTCDGLPEVQGNAVQLSQLLQNLISNGIKYSDAEVPAVHISATAGEDGCQVSVSDNGIGIAPQYFQRIFQPFKRLHGTNEYAGSGLGLSICKKVVEAHGGRIWCESESGKGTTFHFILPKRDLPGRTS
jgi:signal transduction histidine kinase